MTRRHICAVNENELMMLEVRLPANEPPADQRSGVRGQGDAALLTSLCLITAKPVLGHSSESKAFITSHFSLNYQLFHYLIMLNGHVV